MSLIAIVDDRVTNRKIFAKLAASIEDGVEVRSFGDPREALEWLAFHPVDLVITDYKMPSMDGAEFIRHFRELPNCADIPVVVITVYEERSFRLKALESGATDFLHSPVDHHEFTTRCRNLLKLHRNQLLLASRADLLERRLEHSERSVRDSSERLAQVIDTLPVMISASDGSGTLLFVNSCHAAFAGLEQTTAVGVPVERLFGPEHGARSRSLDRMVFETGRPLPAYEEELCGQVGGKRVFLTTKSPLKDLANKVTGVLTSSLDISSRKKMEAHLRHLAHHDPLTDLPNRTLLRERMRRLIARARRGDHVFALHLLDLDGFKAVNDVLGHSAGDRFLKQVAARLRETIRDEDTLARLGGDEFAILQTNVMNNDEAADLARRILAVVSEEIDFENSPIRTTGSIGIALHPADGLDAEDLLKNADLAMYRAKGQAGNRFCFYAADMHARARQQAQLDVELRKALEEQQFMLYYQPQIDLRSGRVIGAEALLRWNRPGVGIVAPGQFLARAEENGLIIPLTEWVLLEACHEAHRWPAVSGAPLRIGVNMSPVQFRNRTVPLLVARSLAESRLDAKRLDLELTESIVMQDLPAVVEDLRQLLRLGVNVSIDDFGTGYSSLSYVKQLPITRLKIDQSFIRNLITDPNDAAIVRAIITLGHSMDLAVLAEGVETEDHAVRLRSEGCDEAQGYHFGRPMPAADFRAMLSGMSGVARTA
jgi:diguanylate cyclase (GGDEF)-like protein/PAS domain S-box-containing protein